MKKATQNVENLEIEFELLSQNADFYELPNLYTIGISDIDRHSANIDKMHERIKIAENNNSYIEITALLAQYMELFLRMFVVVKSGKDEYSKGDKPTLGRLINDCKKLGFNEDVITQLEIFKNTRNEIIHNYLLGGIEDSEISALIENHRKLDKTVIDYVAKEIGRKIHTYEEISQSEGSTLITINRSI